MKSELDQFLAAYSDDFPYAFDNAIILNWYPRRIISSHSPRSRVLELGIGHGVTCDLFASHFDHYEVVDGSPAVVQQFQNNFPNTKAIIHEGYFENFVPSGIFDLIVMGFVLEHVDNPKAIVERYLKFLSPNGRIAVAVPNAASLHRRIGVAAGVLQDLNELGDGDKALGHLRSFTVETLDLLLESAGFTVTLREGIFLKPFTTEQLKKLNLPHHVLEGMCVLGCQYPGLSAALLFEAKAS